VLFLQFIGFSYNQFIQINQLPKNIYQAMNKKINLSKLLSGISKYVAVILLLQVKIAFAQSPNSFRMEAEDMQSLQGFEIEEYGFASGKKVVAIKNGITGELVLPFTGSNNRYKITIGYYDESDGKGSVELFVAGNSIRSFTFDATNNANFVYHLDDKRRELTNGFIEIEKGQEIKISSTKDGDELMRIDYLEFEAEDGIHHNPTIELISPITSSTYRIGDTAILNTSIEDGDGDEVDFVEFYANDDLIGIDNTFPFLLEWKNLQKGNYAIYAKVVNSNRSTAFTGITQISVFDGNEDNCIVPYLETEEYVIIEAENGEFGADEGWKILTDTAGYIGAGYIQWDNGDQFGVPGKGTITYKLKISTAGLYTFQMRNKINVFAPTNPQAEHNDFWLRSPDAQMIVETSNGISYPVNGFGVPSGANLMEDSRREGWTKVFSANVNAWGFDTRTKDYKGLPGPVYFNFASPGVYTIQISGRSVGHGLDRLGFELKNKPGTWGANTTLGETLCSEDIINQYPIVEIISPSFNQNFTSGTTEVTVEANASDASGSIAKVDFYLNNELKVSDNQAPFEFVLNNLQDSIFTITAKAYDNDNGLTSKSSVFSIGNYNLGNRAPDISLTSPFNGQEFQLGDDIFINSQVSDPENNLDRISYFANGKLIANKYNNETSYTWDPTEPGEYIISARAIDDFELTTEANPITINVISPNIFPTASISSPSFNTIFAEGEAIDIESNVADEDGTIERVVFFANGDQIGEVTAAPFNFSWTGATSGEYELTIQAFDNDGDSKTSDPVNVVVNVPPTISLDAPADNAVIAEGQNIVFEVNAADADGTVQKVDYLNGNELLASVTEAPFSYTLTQAAVGTYEIKAIVYDDYNITAESNTINITVNAKPQITITSPTNNTVVPFGESVNFTVDVSDSDGSVDRVVYFNGDTQLGESTAAPFSYTWENPAAGTYSVRAIVYDDNNASSISENITVIVNQLPEVSLLRPEQGDSFEVGQVITIEAAASDADGSIQRVEFILDGVKIGEDRTAPYIYNIGNLELGTYELVVNAIDDRGAVSSTEPFSIVLNFLPTVQITSPTSGISVEAGTVIDLEVEVADQDGDVVKVEYYSNDLLIATVEEAPFSFSWTDAPTGMQEITAHAYDDKNGKTVSEKVTVNVSLNVPPTVTLTAPTAATVIQDGESLEIRVSAVDGDGTIAKVEFYADDELLGEDDTQPYSFNWIAPAIGTYQVKAKAIDDKNASSFTDEIEVKVNEAPQVSISTPTAGENFIPGTTISILASARDTDGLVNKVEFMVDGEKVGESLSSPFTIDWDKTDPGIYEIMAIATDENGGIGESEAVKIYIKDPNVAAARLVSVTQDTTVAPQAIVPLQAVAEGGYEVSKVEFIVNGLVEGEDTESPFEMNLQVGADGAYEVQVRAYYQDNGVFESGITTVTVDRALSLEKGVNAEISMQVYPNPVANMAQLLFNLDKPQTVRISLTDITGNSIVNTTALNAKVGENTFQFSLENLPKGMYLLHLKAGDKRYVNKVMKQ